MARAVAAVARRRVAPPAPSARRGSRRRAGRPRPLSTGSPQGTGSSSSSSRSSRWPSRRPSHLRRHVLPGSARCVGRSRAFPPPAVRRPPSGRRCPSRHRCLRRSASGWPAAPPRTSSRRSVRASLSWSRRRSSSGLPRPRRRQRRGASRTPSRLRLLAVLRAPRPRRRLHRPVCSVLRQLIAPRGRGPPPRWAQSTTSSSMTTFSTRCSACLEHHW